MVAAILDYNRVHNLFSELTSANTKQIGDIEGFGIDGSDLNTLSVNEFPGISPGGYNTVCTKLLCGLFKQIK